MRKVILIAGISIAALYLLIGTFFCNGPAVEILQFGPGSTLKEVRAVYEQENVDRISYTQETDTDLGILEVVTVNWAAVKYQYIYFDEGKVHSWKNIDPRLLKL